MNNTDLANLIKNRRSIRNWQDKPVPEDLIMQAIELATWAPNGGNQQNWHFYVIINKTTIKDIENAVNAGRNLMASWPETKTIGGFPAPPPPTPGQPPAPPRSPLSTAPAIIAVGTMRSENPMARLFAARAQTDPVAARMAEWNTIIDSRIQSVSAAIAYLLLVLNQMGLGAVWMTGPLPQSKGEVERLLQCPAGMDIVALIPLGYPAESPTRTRHPVSEVVTMIR